MFGRINQSNKIAGENLRTNTEPLTESEKMKPMQQFQLSDVKRFFKVSTIQAPASQSGACQTDSCVAASKPAISNDSASDRLNCIRAASKPAPGLLLWKTSLVHPLTC